VTSYQITFYESETPIGKDVVVAATAPAASAAEPAATEPTWKPDFSTPQAAAISYFEAVMQRDAAAIKATAFYDAATERLIDTSVAYDRAQHDYAVAVGKRFGKEAGRQANLDALNEDLIEIIKKSAVHEHGDTADIGENGDYPCRRVGEQSRYDLVRLAQNSPPIEQSITYSNKAAEVFEKFAKDIAAGRWATLEQMEKDLDAAMPAAPMPPGQ
jgi:hypothetical protein